LLGGVSVALFLFQGCGTTKGTHIRPSYDKGEGPRTVKETEIENKTGETPEEPLIDESKELEELSEVLKSQVGNGTLKSVVDSYIGTPYKHGGTSKSGMDCSGFVWRVFTDLGNKNFPRTSSAALSTLGKSVTRVSMRPGDLLFFRRGRRIDHVGIFMGHNIFAHASSSSGVMYTELESDYFKKRIVCIRRM
jgi:hypothetical protein